MSGLTLSAWEKCLITELSLICEQNKDTLPADKLGVETFEMNGIF
jgi:hypothetical protein